MSDLRDKELIGYMEHKTQMAIFLVNGIKLRGVIEDFSDDVIVLKDGGVVAWHAVSTVRRD